ncbi:hypothetical protein AB751O23_CF_00030 [Chlamydiales bacterium SCGC AB-751-O23]|jgi:HEAT repeat protein|nr:hypothetical protein AB751O23_CF_00030 [Chlamydiales bacterium SCGC AB-751-O23]
MGDITPHNGNGSKDYSHQKRESKDYLKILPPEMQRKILAYIQSDDFKNALEVLGKHAFPQENSLDKLTYPGSSYNLFLEKTFLRLFRGVANSQNSAQLQRSMKKLVKATEGAITGFPLGDSKVANELNLTQSPRKKLALGFYQKTSWKEIIENLELYLLQDISDQELPPMSTMLKQGDPRLIIENLLPYLDKGSTEDLLRLFYTVQESQNQIIQESPERDFNDDLPEDTENELNIYPYPQNHLYDHFYMEEIDEDVEGINEDNMWPEDEPVEFALEEDAESINNVNEDVEGINEDNMWLANEPDQFALEEDAESINNVNEDDEDNEDNVWDDNFEWKVNISTQIRETLFNLLSSTVSPKNQDILFKMKTNEIVSDQSYFYMDWLSAISDQAQGEQAKKGVQFILQEYEELNAIQPPERVSPEEQRVNEVADNRLLEDKERKLNNFSTILAKLAKNSNEDKAFELFLSSNQSPAKKVTGLYLLLRSPKFEKKALDELIKEIQTENPVSLSYLYNDLESSPLSRNQTNQILKAIVGLEESTNLQVRKRIPHFLALLITEESTEEVIKTLTKMLKEEDSETLSAVTACLRGIKQKVQDGLNIPLENLDLLSNEVFKTCKEKLQDPNPWCRLAAVEALEELKEPRSIALIKSVSQDSDDRVRLGVINSLGSFSSANKIEDEAYLESEDFSEVNKVNLPVDNEILEQLIEMLEKESNYSLRNIILKIQRDLLITNKEINTKGFFNRILETRPDNKSSHYRAMSKAGLIETLLLFDPSSQEEIFNTVLGFEEVDLINLLKGLEDFNEIENFQERVFEKVKTIIQDESIWYKEEEFTQAVRTLYRVGEVGEKEEVVAFLNKLLREIKEANPDNYSTLSMLLKDCLAELGYPEDSSEDEESYGDDEGDY